MNRQAFLRGYLTKYATAEALTPTPEIQAVPQNAEEAAAIKEAMSMNKVKLRTDVKKLDLEMARLRALKKQKELQLSTT
jgi:hypothetical protein